MQIPLARSLHARAIFAGSSPGRPQTLALSDSTLPWRCLNLPAAPAGNLLTLADLVLDALVICRYSPLFVRRFRNPKPTDAAPRAARPPGDPL